MTTTPPPPPDYAPTVGLNTTWWTTASDALWTPERMTAAEAAHARLAAAMDDLSRNITETPAQRAQRLRDEDDARREARGETPSQRRRRHRAEDRYRRGAAQRAATRLWKTDPAERARRFRRWCLLTALSASAGYAAGLVQWLSTAPPTVIAFLGLPATYWLDLKMRGGWYGAARLSGMHGWRPICAVLATRIPFASVLASVLRLDSLLAATGHLLSTRH
ncbi:hypothetical protein BX265_4969 [Streptomyces sp. TLI_235]|nr:hypothetical protein [Streptomyces sp. TLI_235]PBC80133.1 hypothetical protein BX265_4969 [Streptomyces sp. TLI_235]